MKRIFLTLLCLFILCGTSQARMLQGVAGAVTVAPFCSTPSSFTSADSGYMWFGSSSSLNQIIAGSFTSASTFTGQSLVIKMKKVGSPSFNITPAFCTDSSGYPGTCTNLDESIATSAITTSHLEYCFNYSTGYSLSASTRYHIKLSADGIGDSSNVIVVGGWDDGTATEYYNTWVSTAWTRQDSTMQIYYKIMDCSCTAMGY